MRDLNVAVWGLGPHAVKKILPAIDASAGLELTGVCSRNAEIVAAAQDRYACRSWRNPSEMLADPGVDVVYAATPTGLHAEHGNAVLSAGKHFWSEKPLAERLDQALSLAALSRERGLTLAEGFMYLYHPHFLALREIVRSGRLGQVLSVECRFGIPTLERPGFRRDPHLGGGAFLDLGTYPVSALTALFPDAVPIVSFAEIVSAPGSLVDTGGRAVLGYEGGASAVLEWWTDSTYRNEIDVRGTQGSVQTERLFSKLVDHVPRFRFLDVRGNECTEDGRAGDAFVHMFTAFRGLVDDPAGAECERALIERRARLMEEIRNHSGGEGG